MYQPFDEVARIRILTFIFQKIDTSATISITTGNIVPTPTKMFFGLFPYSSSITLQPLELHSNPNWPHKPKTVGKRQMNGKTHTQAILNRIVPQSNYYLKITLKNLITIRSQYILSKSRVNLRIIEIFPTAIK